MKKQKLQRTLHSVINNENTLVLKNANVINVFTEEIQKADVAILDDIIIGIGEFSGENEIDLNGKYLSAGFIDSHLHIESSMSTPQNYASVVMPYGTTSIIADPHEIANVCGIEGIEFFLEQSEGLPLHIYFMMPSCVPCTPFEHNGVVLTSEKMAKLSGNERIIGLGEVMDYISLTTGEDSMMNKIEMYSDKIIDGHAPLLKGKTLDAYCIAGPVTDHECSTYEEVMDRLRRGLKVLIRMGSAANDVSSIFAEIAKNNLPTNNIMFCTDDKHLEDLKTQGHINYIAKTAVACGISPIKAIQMATINSALTYKLDKVGAIAPGYKADLVVLNDLKDFEVDSVYVGGKLLDANPVFEQKKYSNNVLDTVNFATLKDDSFKVEVKNPMPVLEVIKGQIVTKLSRIDVPQENGIFTPKDDLLKLAVIERHHAKGNIGIGIVKGFGLKNAALASTVAHDSHNLMVIGDNDRDMTIAVNELKKCGGGYALVSEGKIVEILPLPIAGLITDDCVENILEKQKSIITQAYAHGVDRGCDPFINLSFLALPVIPEVRVTDMGMFDVIKAEFIK